MAQRLARWRRFTEVIGEGRRTLPLASPQGPRAAGAVRERLQLHDRCDRPRAGTVARRAIAAACALPGPGGEARRRLASALLLAGCAGTPSVSGVRGASPAPAGSVDAAAGRGAAGSSRPIPRPEAAVPPDLADRMQRLTLAEIVDLGLRNNPTTRLAWANAQTAASIYGSERGAWFPTIDGDVSAIPAQDGGEPGSHRGRAVGADAERDPQLSAVRFRRPDRTGRRCAAAARSRRASPTTRPSRTWCSRSRSPTSSIWPTAPCSGRSAPRWRRRRPTSPRPRSAAGWASPPSPTCSRPGPRRARRSSISRPSRATCRPPAAHWRSRSGCRPTCRTTWTRPWRSRRWRPLADSVNAIIATALQGRPDLAAIRAEVEAARADISEARAALLPSLGFSATGGRTYATTIPDGANSYTLSLGLSIPIFNGFSRQYDLRAAEFEAEAARARARVAPATRWSSRSSAPTTRSRPRPAGSAPPRICSPAPTQSNEVALGRYKAGVGSVLDLLAAQTRARRAPGRSGWRRGSPGACRWPSSRTTRACSTPGSRARSGSLTRHHDGTPTMIATPLAPSPSCSSRPRRLQGDGAAAGTAGPGHRWARRSGARCRSSSRRPARSSRCRPSRCSRRSAGRSCGSHSARGRTSRRDRCSSRSIPGPSRRLWPRRRRSCRARPRPGGERASRRRSATPSWPSGSTSPRSSTTRRAPLRPRPPRRWPASEAAVAEARLNLQYATIRAPIAGRTGSLRVREGNLVRASDATPLVTINQIRPILVRFAVPAANLPLIQQYRSEKLVVRAEPVGGGHAERRGR